MGMSVMRKLELRARYTFLLPAVLWVLAFTIFPLVYSLVLSFYRFRLAGSYEFTGLGNYARALRDGRLLSSLQITALFTGVSVVAEILLGMLLALCANQSLRGLRFFRTVLVMPLFATPVAVGFLGMTLFYEEGGPINSFLNLLGLAKVPWLSQPNWAIVAVLILNIWQWTPFAFLVLLSGLQSLPREVYEASALETNSGWKVFWYITFPMLRPIAIILVVLRSIEALKILDLPYVLTEGGPGRATEVMSMLIYRTGFKAFDLGYASALSYLMLLTVVLLVTLFFRRVRETYE